MYLRAHFERDGFRMRVVGSDEGLDPYQRLIHERADGIDLGPLLDSVSTAIGSEVASELAGTALETPPGGRMVPRATTASLACSVVGCACVIVASGGWFGVLGVGAVWLGHRAAAARRTSRGHRLSEAGYDALVQLERWLDARIRGLDVSEYGEEETGIYVALKPMAATIVPGEGTYFRIHVGPAEEHPPPRPSIGPKLSKEARKAARRTNTLRAIGRLSSGIAVLMGGIGFAVALDPEFDGATTTATTLTVLALLLAWLADRWCRRDGADFRWFR